MPILAYFSIAGPLLLVALLTVSAVLEPEKAPTTAELLGISSAKADSGGSTAIVQEHELSEFERLKQRPIGR